MEDLALFVKLDLELARFFLGYGGTFDSFAFGDFRLMKFATKGGGFKSCRALVLGKGGLAIVDTMTTMFREGGGIAG